MSEVHWVGHCGKVLLKWKLCYPRLVDDLCVDRPLNGWDLEEEDHD